MWELAAARSPAAWGAGRKRKPLLCDPLDHASGQSESRTHGTLPLAECPPCAPHALLLVVWVCPVTVALRMAAAQW
jgi:hypothetical protein